MSLVNMKAKAYCAAYVMKDKGNTRTVCCLQLPNESFLQLVFAIVAHWMVQSLDQSDVSV